MRKLFLVMLLSALVLPAQTVTEQAEEAIKKDKQEARVKEAKKLLIERGKKLDRVREIEERLKELDEGAKVESEIACLSCSMSGVLGDSQLPPSVDLTPWNGTTSTDNWSELAITIEY